MFRSLQMHPQLIPCSMPGPWLPLSHLSLESWLPWKTNRAFICGGSYFKPNHWLRNVKCDFMAQGLWQYGLGLLCSSSFKTASADKGILTSFKSLESIIWSLKRTDLSISWNLTAGRQTVMNLFIWSNLYNAYQLKETELHEYHICWFTPRAQW